MSYSACLQSLSFRNLDTRLEAINPPLVYTCTWLLEDREFRRWWNNQEVQQQKRMLWIKGKAGVGKSTLMKTAFEHVYSKAQPLPCLTAGFFFNARGHALEKSDVCFETYFCQSLKKSELHAVLTGIGTYKNFNAVFPDLAMKSIPAFTYSLTPSTSALKTKHDESYHILTNFGRRLALIFEFVFRVDTTETSMSGTVGRFLWIREISPTFQDT